MNGIAAESAAFRAGADGIFYASTPHMAAVYDGIGLSADRGGETLRIEVRAWGRADALTPVPAGVPVAGDCVPGLQDASGDCVRRVEADRGELTEWWVGRTDGVEQGFDLAESPAGDGPIQIVLDIDGADVDHASDDALSLVGAGGESWSYQDLVVWDANGEDVPARFVLDGDAIIIEVDDRDAAWPITVDPLLTSPTTTITGPYYYSSFGRNVAGIGDVNNDGYDDIAVSSPDYYYYYGGVWVYHGSASGVSSTAAITLYGSGYQDYFGSGIDGAGDVNGDGYDDLVIGERGDETVWLYYGSSSGISSSSYTYRTGSSGSDFGQAVAGVGDIDNNGYDDIAVAAPDYDNDKGRIYIYEGSSSGLGSSSSVTITGSSENISLGYSVAGAGDVNNDGYDDVIAGAPYYSSSYGRAYIYHGSSGTLSSSATTTITGAGSSYYLGYSVSGAGDVNNDGYDDVLIGAYGVSSGTGRAYVHHGSSSGISSSAARSLSGASSSTYFGVIVAGAGDVNADGYSDIVVGASGGDDMYYYEGSSSGIGSTATQSFSGTSGSSYGRAVDGAGDVNGDTYDDVVVGAYEYNYNYGQVYVYHGYRDADGDGYYSTVDCDDTNAAINPGATETCDGVDNDCDGSIDEGTSGSTTYYPDTDGDGYGNASSAVTSCTQPSGYITTGGDCNDSNPAINPGATEACDAVDNDCDGSTDEAGSTGASLWYRDSDGDNYGTAASTTAACTQPSGYVGNSTDCNDSSASINPGATEVCDGADNDCDGSIDESGGTIWYRDADSDSYGSAATTTTSCSQPTGYVSNASDCNDGTALANPGATESCDSIDNDCDGAIDESGGSTWYQDADGDTYGNTSVSSTACTRPSGYVATGGDCNDTTSAARPGATETCDDIDNDCDGAIDEAGSTGSTTWYRDSDTDGFGTSSFSTTACDQPSGFVSNNTDCNDGSSSANPAAAEVCDGIDNDCDGSVDEAGSTGSTTWYYDGDSDGYGSPSSSTTTSGCSQPSGFVGNDDDCNDSNAAISPADAEVCDGVDNDCDGSTDESGGSTWYQDADADGYGNPGTSTVSCSAPSGYIANGTDCNDSSAAVSPGVTESCDDIDNDCDGSVDETGASGESVWYRDSDSDGFGSSTSVSACDQPSGYSNNDTDCNDANSAINPLATEICDGIDNDCDGSADEVGASGEQTWYADSDADGYGSASSSTTSCSQPTGYVSDSTDCNDSTAAANPGATESCDSIDNDCDGSTDEAGASGETTWYADNDADGYGADDTATASCNAPTGYLSVGGDCNDASAAINPDATEACNDYDDDCDGEIDEAGATGESLWYVDTDGDGFGDTATVASSCDQPSGYVVNDTDCDDTDAAISPLATEVCDGVDNDCDGDTDGSDASDTSTWYVDADGDGYGDPATDQQACDAPSGTIATGGDCDDTNSAISPDATEVCDGLDNDCDAEVDEAGAEGEAAWYADADADGYGDAAVSTVACDAPDGYITDSSDCNDTSPAAYPSAPEVCDDIDNDCDGSSDESGAIGESTWYLDGDSDGYGNDIVTSVSCDAPTGFTSQGGDCNDADAAYNPGASESCTDTEDYNCDGSTGSLDLDGDGYQACEDCNDADASVNPGASELCDGVDNNCDGTADNDAADAVVWYADVDTDGYGDATVSAQSCEQPDGYVSNAEDCNDADAAYNPGATESCDDPNDYNCDGSVGYADADADGYVACEDCSDVDVSINPGATEVCNDIDDNCDGVADEATAADATTWYLDADSDTYGSDAILVVSCDQPSGYVASGGDCNDADAAYNPGATESCSDTEDLNCDGAVGYADGDGDGYPACEDCNDADAAINPGATESCNDVDDDCDGIVDSDAAEAGTWYLDADRDGFGTDSFTMTSCTQPEGYVDVAGDCNDADTAYNPDAEERDCADPNDYNCDGSVGYNDADADGWAACEDCNDANASISPVASESCNEADDNCNGFVDEGVTTTYYADTDADGYGDASNTTRACDLPAGYVENSEDCLDSSALYYPGAPESDCSDPSDYNCDGSIGYTDADADGYAACEECNDADGSINPATAEVCDGLDNNCDGTIDEGYTTTWFFDADGDGYGDGTSMVESCAQPDGYVAVEGDCNDADAAINPGAVETDCTDATDYNCDGFGAGADGDGDGYFACEECNDADGSVNPGAAEVCDGADNNCDGNADEGLTATYVYDGDGDGYGDDSTATDTCAPAEGYVTVGGDCNDADTAYNPGASEDDCTDLNDYNCDGLTYADDSDGDGWVGCEDCNNYDATVSPTATELCDGIDNDCDYVIDDGLTTSWYADADADSYGDPVTVVESCAQPDGYVADGTDCNDTSNLYYPGATETDCADPNDYNCDGSVGYSDTDFDGYAACAECNDNDASINPGAAEVCDGADNNCDGNADEGLLVNWYEDADNDDFGNPEVSVTACANPDGYTADNTDCDDTNASINPDASEIAEDGVDQDCDGFDASGGGDSDPSGDSDPNTGDSDPNTGDSDPPTGDSDPGKDSEYLGYPEDTGIKVDGGCGCATDSTTGSKGALAGGLLLAVALLGRRRQDS